MKILNPKSQILLASLIGSIFVSPALANVDLGIYPPLIKINANPPAGISTPITLENNSSDPLQLQIQIKPFQSSSKNNGTPQIASTLPREYSRIFQEIKITDNGQPVDQIILAPQEEKQLALEINLPKNEPAADYYFSVLFISQSEILKGKTGSAIQAGIGTNVLLTVGPKTQTSGFLRDFSAPWYVSTGPVSFSALIENTSMNYIEPKGYIFTKNMFGQTVGRINLSAVTVLAKSKRYIPHTVWQEKILFGFYTAKLMIALSPDGPLFEKSIHFFAIPEEYILGLILLSLLIASIVWRVRATLKKQ